MHSPTDIDNLLDEWIDAHQDAMIETTRQLIGIPSVKGEPAAGAPFGAEARRALDFVLKTAETYGLEPKNVDGYAGHAEWRSPATAADAPIVGVLAHLDVVPEGEGWKHSPYGAEIEDGILYGRGAIDDKGPAMAAFFALAAVVATGAPLTHRVRLILGCDEESGFECVAHYFAHEEMPATGFTPDGAFPLIFAEKGIATFTLACDFGVEDASVRLVSLSGGLRSNMVPDRATATLDGHPEALKEYASRLHDRAAVAIHSYQDRLVVEARGVSAHGSTPEEGINAIAILAEALLSAGRISAPQTDFLELVKLIGSDVLGVTLGIAGQDDISGHLTSNLGVVRSENGRCELVVNVRYPVTWELEALQNRLQDGIAGTGVTLVKTDWQGPLYVPQDDPLIETLLAVYREQTGDGAEPRAIGGGTYARAMRKGVAFGPTFGNREGGAHQADEHWPVADLIAATRIFARAIYRLATQ